MIHVAKLNNGFCQSLSVSFLDEMLSNFKFKGCIGTLNEIKYDALQTLPNERQCC